MESVDSFCILCRQPMPLVLLSSLTRTLIRQM